MDRMMISVPIAKVEDDGESRIVYGVVYKAATLDAAGKPAEVDTQGNWATAEEVKKACHRFNRRMATAPKDAGVDKQHNEKPGYGTVLESYIAKTAIPDINAAPGDWVAAIEVTDDATWKEIQKGEIEGFSIGGTATIIEDGKGGEKE